MRPYCGCTAAPLPLPLPPATPPFWPAAILPLPLPAVLRPALSWPFAVLDAAVALALPLCWLLPPPVSLLLLPAARALAAAEPLPAAAKALLAAAVITRACSTSASSTTRPRMWRAILPSNASAPEYLQKNQVASVTAVLAAACSATLHASLDEHVHHSIKIVSFAKKHYISRVVPKVFSSALRSCSANDSVP